MNRGREETFMGADGRQRVETSGLHHHSEGLERLPQHSEGSERLSIDEALGYVKAVKEIFKDNREKYDEFLEVMKAFKVQRVDTAGVRARIRDLFKDQHSLILGFNTFLPKGYEITIPFEEQPVELNHQHSEESERLSTDKALAYVKAVKEIFKDNSEEYVDFLEVMKAFKAQRVNTAGLRARVRDLFKDHQSLILGFNTFMPKGYEITTPSEEQPVEFNQAINYVHNIKIM